MRGTVRDVLDRRAASAPGRDRERELLLELIDAEWPLVALVHGIAGVGKTTLVRAVAADARSRGARVALIDGRAVEPTEAGFLAALGHALGVVASSAPGMGRALAERDGRTLVAVDGYDDIQIIDGWLRGELLPELPASTRLLLAGREPPVAAWTRDLGELARDLPLGNLRRRTPSACWRAPGSPPPTRPG